MEQEYKSGKPMEEWLRLVNAETEEELMEIARSTTIPEIKKTVVLLRELSADEQIRAEAEFREKRLHDEATALGHARREGRAEGEAIGIVKGKAEGRAEGIAEEKRAIAERLKSMNFSDEEIMRIIEPQ